MKLLLTAIMLAFAAPAMAQTGADPHAGHGEAASTQPAADQSCAPEHAAMGHCTPKATPAAGAHSGQATKHDGGMPCCEKDAAGNMSCCEKMKAKGKKMDCCEKSSAKAPSAAGAR